jgi:hypothetical protein
MLPRVVLIQLDYRGLDEERPPARHGIAGVYRQVEENLLELTRISGDPWQLGVKLGQDHDVFSHQSPNHHLHPGDYCVQLQNLGLEDLPAAERQQLPGERGGPISGCLDLQHVVAPGIVCREVGQ